ncbi:MAG TPA: PIG-L family deacetylase [Roseiflexaceae bacterium]|jgi:LmbE family N-acetylglucosaminyl deacetylase|nr:PIG-L family deacetylase [Roseiflexaceae bacterium]
MRIEQLDDIREPYQHVYLSPHMDDAALSCGGRILQQRSHGERVLVVTLCSGVPAADTNFSALAQEFHAIWQLSPQEAIAARLREEQAALEILDADHCLADMLDAIYRFPEAYNSRESLFNKPHSGDPLFDQVSKLIAALRQRMPDALMYVPLGVGQHVDHLITYRAARACAGGRMAFYEDFPYVTQPGAFKQRMAELHAAFQPDTIAIDPYLQAKIAAVHTYPSQLDELFGGADAMEQSVTAYAHAIHPAGSAYGERVWLPAA